jgi:hypothetical protein
LVPADATIGWPQYTAAESGNAVLFVAALSSIGHAQDIPGRDADVPLSATAEAEAEADDCADVHADSAIARATATPRTDPMLVRIATSLSGLFYNL